MKDPKILNFVDEESQVFPQLSEKNSSPIRLCSIKTLWQP